MKILCVIDYLGSGGSQRQIVELALGFKEMGNEVSFLTYYDIRFYDQALTEHGISIHCIPEKKYLRRLWKLRKFIRSGNYDGVVSFLEGPSFICEAAGIPFRKWKLVVSEGSANPNIYKSARHIFYRWFHLFADFVVANSYANISIVRKVNPLLPKAKCRVVYNIIDFEKWKPRGDYFPRNDGKLNLLVVASHQSLKNLRGLVEALALLDDEERQKIQVNWYGDRLTEPYFDQSLMEGQKRLVELNLNGMITFHPATNPILPKFQEADALGLFSYYEGFPNVVCEAMACAKPIVCSSVSDLPDLLSHDSNLLCQASDPKSISQALRYLIHLSDEKLLALGLKNEAIAKELFQKEQNVVGYLQLLK